jgi:hypothetical protein
MRTPREEQAILTNLCGRNLYGEPRVRIVWGPDQMEVLEGDFDDKGRIERRTVRKYPFDRWIFEIWEPPTRGEYVLSFVVEDGDGKFVQLTQAMAERYAQRLNRSMSLRYGDRVAHIKSRLDKEEKDRDKFEDDVLDDALSVRSDIRPWVGYGENKKAKVLA